MIVPPEYVLAPPRLSVVVLPAPSVNPPAPAMTTPWVPMAVWLTVNVCPPLLIVSVLMPLLGGLRKPDSVPLVVGAVADRLRTTLVPGPVLALVTVSAPVGAPSAVPVVAVTVPALMTVAPV